MLRPNVGDDELFLFKSTYFMPDMIGMEHGVLSRKSFKGLYDIWGS